MRIFPRNSYILPSIRNECIRWLGVSGTQSLFAYLRRDFLRAICRNMQPSESTWSSNGKKRWTNPTHSIYVSGSMSINNRISITFDTTWWTIPNFSIASYLRTSHLSNFDLNPRKVYFEVCRLYFAPIHKFEWTEERRQWRFKRRRSDEGELPQICNMAYLRGKQNPRKYSRKTKDWKLILR